MITIISGTNRPGSNSKKVAQEYKRFLAKKNIESKLLSLDEHIVFERDEAFEKMEAEFLKAADRFIIISPEYHGSYPGVLKMLMDNSDVKNVWWNKKVLLTGVSTGRAGNLRGMEHLTGSLLHMKMTVHPNRLPISIVDKLMNEENRFTDAAVINAIQSQLEEFLSF
jgi:chromate reductase, NAD(P)H dehydrogenase (quinone)